jgi:hypothetical protein
VNGHTPNFGERMHQLRLERGDAIGGPGRKPIAEKYKKQIRQVEQAIAGALPELTETYIAELQVKEPERCPSHHRVLGCPVGGCDYQSQRRSFDHRGAAYLMDRMMGRPTTRSENSLTVKFVQSMTTIFVSAFAEANRLPDEHERQERFAELIAEISAAHGDDER